MSFENVSIKYHGNPQFSIDPLLNKLYASLETYFQSNISSIHIRNVLNTIYLRPRIFLNHFAILSVSVLKLIIEINIWMNTLLTQY